MLKFIAVLFFVVATIDVYLHASALNAVGVFLVIGGFYCAISFLMDKLAYED